jgi:hypothetical protein
MNGQGAKVPQTVLLNLASLVDKVGSKIRDLIEEAFLHLGDEHYLINCLLGIKQEAELLEQDVIESKAHSDPMMERLIAFGTCKVVVMCQCGQLLVQINNHYGC